MQNNRAPDWAVTIRAGLDRTERIYRQGEAQARGGWSRLANPYNNDASLAGIWARGWDAGDKAPGLDVLGDGSAQLSLAGNGGRKICIAP